MEPVVELERASLRLRLGGVRNLSDSNQPRGVAAVGGRIEQGPSSVHIVALDDITLELFDGDRVALIGHNGAGKTSFLRLLSGIYQPSQGRCVVRGKRSCLLSVGLGLNGEANLKENIRLALALYGESFGDIDAHIPEVLDFAELTEFADMPLHACSSGMRARLGFAIATSTSPDVFLVDEVLAAGDKRFAKKARARIQSLFEESRVLVLASHSNSMLKKFCNKALWLEHGCVREYGDLADVLKSYARDGAAVPNGRQRRERHRRRRALKPQRVL